MEGGKEGGRKDGKNRGRKREILSLLHLQLNSSALFTLLQRLIQCLLESVHTYCCRNEKTWVIEEEATEEED